MTTTDGMKSNDGATSAASETSTEQLIRSAQNMADNFFHPAVADADIQAILRQLADALTAAGEVLDSPIGRAYERAKQERDEARRERDTAEKQRESAWDTCWREVAKVTEQRDRMRAALEWYANQNNYAHFGDDREHAVGRDSLERALRAAADEIERYGLSLLAPFEAWKLHRYTQPFDDGSVRDPVYVCSVLKGDEWTREEYGRTPELAIRRALGLE